MADYYDHSQRMMWRCGRGEWPVGPDRAKALPAQILDGGPEGRSEAEKSARMAVCLKSASWKMVLPQAFWSEQQLRSADGRDSGGTQRDNGPCRAI